MDADRLTTFQAELGKHDSLDEGDRVVSLSDFNFWLLRREMMLKCVQIKATQKLEKNPLVMPIY